MPRRDSRARLIHQLADHEAFILAETHSQFFRPAALYDNYRHFTHDQLKKMAAGMRPRARGRPEKWTKLFDDGKLTSRVKNVVRNHRLTISAACRAIAAQGDFGSASPTTIKQRYYRALRRQAARRRRPI
jgi:hypothetical protein